MKRLALEKRIRYELTKKECLLLLHRGGKALANVYPKDSSGYAVALMTATGAIFEGVSYKSDTRTLTMHAEMTALANAAINGQTDIAAITGPNCHVCKQLIYESSLRSGIDTVVIVEDNDGVKQIPISILMPYAWPEKPKDNL